MSNGMAAKKSVAASSAEQCWTQPKKKEKRSKQANMKERSKNTDMASPCSRWSRGAHVFVSLLCLICFQTLQMLETWPNGKERICIATYLLSTERMPLDFILFSQITYCCVAWPLARLLVSFYFFYVCLHFFSLSAIALHSFKNRIVFLREPMLWKCSRAARTKWKHTIGSEIASNWDWQIN